MNEFKVITICGSMRFYEGMLRLASEYTMRGIIVLMPFVYHNNGVKAPDDEIGAMLDRMHFVKIDMSSEITVVTNNDNYIGESTRNEIEYAARTGKTIDYYYVG